MRQRKSCLERGTPKGSVLRIQGIIYLDMGRGVGRTDISTRRNRISTMGSGTGSPPLDLEGRRDMGRGGWHQFRWCCKDIEYLCRKNKK